MSKLAKYFALLGVTPYSSKEEIKKAYRKKAKELHPDVSVHPDAEDRFKILNEAYEIILALKDRKRETVFQKVQNQSANQSPSSSQEKSKKRYSKHEAYRKQRMREKKEEFEKLQATDFYKFISALDVMFKLVRVSFPFWVSAIGGIFGYINYGLKGLLLVLLFCAPLWIVLYAYKDAFTGKQILKSFKQILCTTYFYKISTVLVAAFLFFYPLQTLFNLSYYFIAYVTIAIGLIPFLKTLKKQELSLRFLLIGGIPFLLNFFFALNFIFSSHAAKELYHYDIYQYESPKEEVSSYSETGQIYLENNAYEKAFWIRYFSDQNAVVSGKGMINLEFETGLFGLKVLKNYTFGKQK